MPTKFSSLPMNIRTLRTVALIDGANFHATVKSLGFDVDYSLLLEVLNDNFQLLHVNYYTALLDDSTGTVPLRPLVDWLSYNGFLVITKPAKVIINSQTGEKFIKGNMDIEIALGAIRAMGYADHIIIFSGDGDFAALTEYLQNAGKCVTICSSKQCKPPMVADLLRKQANYFIDVNDLRELIMKPMRAYVTPEFVAPAGSKVMGTSGEQTS